MITKTIMDVSKQSGLKISVNRKPVKLNIGLKMSIKFWQTKYLTIALFQVNIRWLNQEMNILLWTTWFKTQQKMLQTSIQIIEAKKMPIAWEQSRNRLQKVLAKGSPLICWMQDNRQDKVTKSVLGHHWNFSKTTTLKIMKSSLSKKMKK